MPKIIAICNQKGGVGKTSTAVSLSAGLALENKKTLLIDLDPQANATSGVGINKSEVDRTIYHALLGESTINEIVRETCVKNLYVVPSSSNLAGAEVELVSEFGREGKLKKALSAVDSSYHYVIIDCPPSFGLLTINALTSAHTLIVPIQCEYYALEGLGQLMKTINLVRDNLNPDLKVEGILMTMADFRTKLAQEVIEEVRKHFGTQVYKTIIPRNIKLSEAPGFGKPIFVYDKHSEGAIKYKEFVNEFIIFNAMLSNATTSDVNNQNVNQQVS
ncbi:MAG: AAA family ATPase [Candidatus Omnitrophota bacterium]